MKQACRLLPCSLAALALFWGAWAQAQVTVNSSPNTVGSGARALGMGGAFIAVADDATAASWNPGGLTQLEAPEMSIVYNWTWSREEFDSSPHLLFDQDFELALDNLNYLSFAYPLRRTVGGRNIVLSLNYQQKYNFDRELKLRFRDITAISGGGIFKVRQDIDYYQDGKLAALSPALGFEVTNKLSAGIVMNIWDQSLLSSNEWKNVNRVRAWGQFGTGALSYTNLETVTEYEDFEATNYTLGVLYKPTNRWSVGAVYNTKFSADVRRKQYIRLFGAGAAVALNQQDVEWEFPKSYGLGVAYRFPNDKLTLSLDWTRREWDEFVEIRRNGNRISPITGLPKYQSFHEPTDTIRLGAEYVFFNPDKPLRDYLPSLRAGIFYDPEPAGGRTDSIWGLSRVSGEPDDYYGVTLGAGVLIKNRINIDAAYQYRWGEDVRNDTFGFPEVRADADQHEFYLSTVVYFKPGDFKRLPFRGKKEKAE